MEDVKNKDVVGLQIRQLSTRDQMTQTLILLITKGHRTAFNNEQSSYLIVSYKNPIFYKRYKKMRY